jgi:hypothetical protein
VPCRVHSFVSGPSAAAWPQAAKAKSMAAASIMQISFFIFDFPTFQAASAAIVPVITESDFHQYP